MRRRHVLVAEYNATRHDIISIIKNISHVPAANVDVACYHEWFAVAAFWAELSILANDLWRVKKSKFFSITIHVHANAI